VAVAGLSARMLAQSAARAGLRVAALDIWETIYLHALRGEDAVVEWAMGSSLRPFLDALPEAARPEFRAAYAEAVRPHYPRRADGSTLLPFRRLFILARV
jgi:trans-aconitate 2-methyltransferase